MRTLANVCLVCSDTETAAEAAREALKIAQEAGIFLFFFAGGWNIIIVYYSILSYCSMLKHIGE